MQVKNFKKSIDDCRNDDDCDSFSDEDYKPFKRKKNGARKNNVKQVEWPCAKCSEVFFTSRQLSHHRRIHKNSMKQLVKTNEIMEDEAKRKRKKETQKREYNKDWPCKKCDEIFPTSTLLKAHRKVHKKIDDDEHTFKFDEIQEIYICNTCSAEYQNKGEVEKHVKTHDVYFSCDSCQQKFKKPYDFSSHMITHSEDQIFRCPLCSFHTPKRSTMLTHINMVHLKKFYYNCDKCGKGFNDIVKFKQHDNEHLGIKPFICIVCEKTFTYSQYLTYHQVRHHTVKIEGEPLPNQCCYCRKVYSKQETLEKHYRNAHYRLEPMEKKYLCDTCGKGFAGKDKLKIHYRSHTGDKPYACTYCEKAFTSRQYLVMHERIHSGEKPYSCEFCGKCFNQDAPLRIHLRGHTGERPYICPFCNAGFTSRGSLNNHQKSCNGVCK